MDVLYLILAFLGCACLECAKFELSQVRESKADEIDCPAKMRMHPTVLQNISLHIPPFAPVVQPRNHKCERYSRCIH